MNTRWLTLAVCFVVWMLACDVCDGGDHGPATGPTTVPRAHDWRVDLVPIPMVKAPLHDADGLAVSASGYLAAVNSSLVVWKPNAPQTWRIRDKKGAPSSPMCFSPDGSLLACPSGADSRVQQDAIFVNIWSVPEGKHVLELPHPWLSEVRSVAFSPRGTAVATATAGMGKAMTFAGDVRLWEYPSGKLMETFHIRDPVLSVAFSPDEASLALACGNRFAGYGISKPCRAVLIDVKNGRERLSVVAGSLGVAGVDFGADGKLLITVDQDQKACGWDVTNGQLIYTLPIRVGSFAVTPDRQWVVTGSREGIRFWDSRTGESVDGSSLAWEDRRPPARLAVGQNLLAAATSDGAIVVWSWTVVDRGVVADNTQRP